MTELDEKMLARWAGYDREEAIRQAESNYKLFIALAEQVAQAERERDEARAALARAEQREAREVWSS